MLMRRAFWNASSVCFQYQGSRLEDRLVGLCADGTSVNLGQEDGLVAKIHEYVPHLIDIHCMTHRPELALLQVQSG